VTRGGVPDPADELERLRRDLEEAREQLAATTEVLTTVGRSSSDLDAVLQTVVQSARRLCRSDVAEIHLVEGDRYRLASWTGHTAQYLDFVTQHPIALDRRTLIGRIGVDRLIRGYGRAQQIQDVLADPEYGRYDIQQIAGYRSILGAPMILDGEVVGVLSVWRTHVDPFSERAVQVLTTFAPQAAIAIRNVDLVCALEARQTELAAKVEQLEALGEIGQAVSSSLDLDQVLKMIVTHAVQLSSADGGSIFEFDEVAEQFEVRTAFGTSQELINAIRSIRVGLHETFVGRAALQRRSAQIADLRAQPLDLHLQKLLDGGWLSVIAAPILRDDRIVGALVVRRRTPGLFSEAVGELLETFAGQSALAIVNARLFRELERKGAELEVASKHKSEFLASMSHELRTPLNAVIGFSDVLLERLFGDLNDRQEEYVRDILESGRHLLELLNEILDLSKVEAGRMELSPTAFPVREALEYGTLMIRESAASRDVKVMLDVDDSVNVIDADEQRFKQVVLNLLSNAVKFTRQRIDVSARCDGTTLTVSVSDDGQGVAPEDRARIFESFQQGRRGSSKEEGTGLGLTLSKRIVELHGGQISLKSDLGVGSTFSFTIPLTTNRTRDDKPAEVAQEASGRPVVVIVEDDPRSLDLLCLYVKDAGVDVVTAADGGQGLELIRRVRPAAVVLDIYLPTLDGWDLLALLKADPATAPIPVVVVSMVDERGKGFALGAAEYLVKPVGRDEVLAALARVSALPDTDQTLVSIGEDPGVLGLVRAALEPEGWTVLNTISGPEGVKLAKSRRPAVVLLDLLTTGEDGMAVVDALRGDPITAAVPIIAITSQTMSSEDKERPRGQIDYVTRDGEFDAAGLVDFVRRAIRNLAASAPEPS
jgi:signal transduction histidine kinase/DNA-binding response OmpR family regulator